MTDQKLAYWVDLKGIAFEDGRPDSSWLQAFPVGEYTHEVYGKIKMTVDRARTMAHNIISRVRGIDLAIDYGHDSSGEAAGWVTSAEARQDGLWLFVEWTKEAANSIREGKYRYFSPEYMDAWTHPQTGDKFKDVMVGGGLTNRPFLKNILPVNLSEIEGHQDPQAHEQEGGGTVGLLEQLQKALELGEDADEDAIMEALATALQPDPKVEDDPETLSEEQVAKILEEHPALAGMLEENKRLADTNRALTGRVVNLEVSARESDISVKLDDWHRGGDEEKHGLAPALDEAISEFMMTLDEEARASFTEILDAIVKTGLVTFKETPVRRRTGENTNPSVLIEVEAGIKALMEANDGMEYGDASALYFVENEDMYDKYQRSLDDSPVDEEVEN